MDTNCDTCIALSVTEVSVTDMVDPYSTQVQKFTEAEILRVLKDRLRDDTIMFSQTDINWLPMESGQVIIYKKYNSDTWVIDLRTRKEIYISGGILFQKS